MVIPLIKLEYRLTKRSRFQFGMQGFGAVLPYSATDLVDAQSAISNSAILCL